MSDDNEQRITDVHMALNHVPTLCSIKRNYFFAIAAMTMVVFLFSQQVLLSLGIGVVVYSVVLAASRKDLDYINLYLAAVSLPAIYDAGKFAASRIRES